MRDTPRLRITQKDFLALPEYSSTIPTGGRIGKRWRRDHQWRDDNGEIKSRWYIGEYVPDEEPGYSRVKWYIPLIEREDGFII